MKIFNKIKAKDKDKKHHKSMGEAPSGSSSMKSPSTGTNSMNQG
jgi:hypothetical protein